MEKIPRASGSSRSETVADRRQCMGYKRWVAAIGLTAGFANATRAMSGSLSAWIVTGGTKDRILTEKDQYWQSSDYTTSTSLLNDKTLAWDPDAKRPWLDPELPENERPPAMLVLTGGGWNHENQAKGLTFSRSIRETELFTAIINHPWFHPTAWHDIQNHNGTILPNVRYYVFIDKPQCFDYHYPTYGGGYEKNLDLRMGRTDKKGNSWRIGDLNNHPVIKNGRLFQEQEQEKEKSAKAIVFECGGWGAGPIRSANGTGHDWPVAVVSISTVIPNANEEVDQGLIPPAPKPIQLEPWEIEDIQTCAAEAKRSLEVVYVGNYRSGRNSDFTARHGGARGGYQKFHDNNRTFILRHFQPEFNTSQLANMTYHQFMRKTSFGLAPRGDCKFSYRFTEVLSAGAIPVIHADDWVWPFRPEIVDWSECAVILPEKDSGQVALDYLQKMSLEQRCRRRRKCYEIYQTYVETPEGQIQGLLEGWELLATHPEKRLPMIGVRCNTTHPDPDCNLERR